MVSLFNARFRVGLCSDLLVSSDGLAGLEAISQRVYDCVIMDVEVNLPSIPSTKLREFFSKHLLIIPSHLYRCLFAMVSRRHVESARRKLAQTQVRVYESLD